MINYSLEGPKWTGATVTWSFAPVGDSAFTDAIGAAYQSTIRAAVAQWAAVTNVSIQEVAPGTPGADVKFGWGSFSGSQIGETEYSYQPGSTQSFLPGMTIHIEDPSLLALAPTAGATYQNTGTTLYEVALHEFGHALGLGLSSDPDSVMYLNLGSDNAAIDGSDLAGIQALYGVATTPSVHADTSSPSAPPPPAPDTITLSADKVGVFRFFDTATGTQFLTGNANEADKVIADRPDMTYEGLAMAGIAPTANDPNAVPVYRFFDVSNGTHFFTTSATEEASIAATRSDLVLEQATFDEHKTQQAGDSAVYRFFDSQNGTHFFTDSGAERATIAATRPQLTYEGVAFYAPSMN